jgi:hypothetical protein
MWRLPMTGDSLMLYVGLSRVRTLAGLYLNEPITDAVVQRAVPSLELLNELDRWDQLQAIELRSEPHRSLHVAKRLSQSCRCCCCCCEGVQRTVFHII